MSVWLLESRDPLIFRDGRPFSANPGARAKSLAFPFPSTIAGATRTRAGMDFSGRFDRSRIEDLLTRRLRGPLLVELDADNRINDWLLPAPHDALLLQAEESDAARLVPLTVLETPPGASTDLEMLALVGAVEPIREKPLPDAPTFWRWSSFLAWLKAPLAQSVTLSELGHRGPQRESRMHVSIETSSQTALEGALFQTAGLEFAHLAKGNANRRRLSKATPLALALETDAVIKEGMDFLGGERRIAFWRQADVSLPACPAELEEAVVQSRHCRLILVTPAYFTAGYLPDWVLNSQPGLEASVAATALYRYQVVSGWDYNTGHPKPTRRLAPAGAVYFLKLEGSDTAIRKFVKDTWLQAVSDDEQARRDGFGLAVVGAWDGAPKTMEVTS